MSGSNWLWCIPVWFVPKIPVAMLNTYHLDLIAHFRVNKFQSA